MIYFTSLDRRSSLFLSVVALGLFYTACGDNQNETAGQNDSPTASAALTTNSPGAVTQAPNAATSEELGLSPANKFEGITVIANAKISQSSDGLLIRAETNDPQLAMPLFKANGQGKWTVHVKMSSPAPTILQVFFGTRSQPAYNEAHSIRKEIVKGNNDVTLEINDPGFAGTIRFDPGTVPGDYILNLIEIKPSR